MNRLDPESAEGKLAAARIVELHARGRWYRTLNDFQSHTTASGIASRVLEEARETGGEIATRAINAAKARPLTAGLIVAGVVALLFRRPLARGFGKLISRRRATRARRR